ncbi:MAG: HAD-IB family phosphatase [Candidatus Levybacteria bacterium]|nr:HAD-IB family phosphatase [Candidatus Levybacteria bacterium]
MDDHAFHTDIFFDVDSTIVTFEGIDYLGEQKGVGEDVTRLTDLAMNGKLRMEQVFEEKINLVSPSKKELQTLSHIYLTNMTPGAEVVMEILTSLNKKVYLISGGFLDAILPLSRKLGLPKKNIFANRISFKADGKFDSLDMGNPLVTSQGKKTIISKLKIGKNAAFIGDGATDLTTASIVKTFIGFGGVAKRTSIREKAEHYITEKNLIPVLRYILTPQEKNYVIKSHPHIRRFFY